VRIFGKCNKPLRTRAQLHVGSHREGAVDPKSGFVVDLKKLKDIMNKEVLDALDHRFLNKEVPEFTNRIPTTENIAMPSGRGWCRSSTRRNCIACGCMNAGSVRRFLRGA